MPGRVRNPPSRQIPCRVMSKSVDNEEHNYIPDTENLPKFDGVKGCKITQKNKCMGEYRYIYPMLDPDGKTRLVTERDFHKRIMHKYRHFEGYSYIYPVLTSDVIEGKTNDFISSPKVATTFVPEEVDRMIPLGVQQILTDYENRSQLFIASNRGEIYPAATKRIPSRADETKENGEAEKPIIKSVSELNEAAEPKPSKKQLKDIERWKKQMEELNRFGSNLCGNRVVYFGNEVNREEWKDDDIMSWFAENYPEDTEAGEKENQKENVNYTDDEQTADEDYAKNCNGTDKIDKNEGDEDSCSVDECDSGYIENMKHVSLLSRMSTESFNSDILKAEDDLDNGLEPNQEEVSATAEFPTVTGEKDVENYKSEETPLFYVGNSLDPSDGRSDSSEKDVFPADDHKSLANCYDIETCEDKSDETTCTKLDDDSEVISKERGLSRDSMIGLDNLDEVSNIDVQCMTEFELSNHEENIENKEAETKMHQNEGNKQEFINCDNLLKVANNERSQEYRRSVSSDINSLNSDLFFNANETSASDDNEHMSFDTCSDGFRTPDLKDENGRNLSRISFSEDIAQIVRTISDFPDQSQCRDSPSVDSRFMDKLINRTDNGCARSLKIEREKLQIPLL